MVQKSMEVQLDNGLEARPVAVFVQVASQYESTISRNGSLPLSFRSAFPSESPLPDCHMPSSR